MSFSIAGTGMCVPEHVVTNEDLAAFLDTSDQWIRQRVGVETRHICTTETTADLAVSAAKAALDSAGMDAGELDLILAATVSGSHVCPSVACLVQSRLGADCPAYDINAACSAFLFLLETADGFFARGRAKNILVVGAERMSGICDWTDRSTCPIFGDGAGAAVLTEGSGYLDAVLCTRGGDEVISIPHFAGSSPWYTGPAPAPYIFMQGQETFKFAVNAICSDVRALLDRGGYLPEDLRWIVPHQANRRILDLAAHRLDIPREKFYTNIERYGNTSSASIPIALDELRRQGQLHRGDLLLLTAFGGGLSHASCLLRWDM